MRSALQRSHARGVAVGVAQSIDALADVVEALMRDSDEFVCSLRFAQARAFADGLDAGRRTATAALLMHRWALTEPEWGDDAEHADALDRWLALILAAA